jgi:hypothetical protein
VAYPTGRLARQSLEDSSPFRQIRRTYVDASLIARERRRPAGFINRAEPKLTPMQPEGCRVSRVLGCDQYRKLQVGLAG